MAYAGSFDPNTGGTTTNTLSRDIHVDTLEAFNRNNIFSALIDSRSITGGTGAQFTIEGKEDTADGSIALYATGTQVSVTDGSVDERVINLDRPSYIARRIDRFDEAVANYDVIAMQVRQMGANLSAKVDRKASAAVEASSLATGVVGNGNGSVVVNTALDGGAAQATTAETKGDEMAESIFAAVAAIRNGDDMNDVYVVMNPTDYSYLVQSGKAVNKDFTNGNGGFDSGKVSYVGGAYVLESNNLPATAGLKALAFTSQAAGIVKLFDVVTNQEKQIDFLDATLLTAYFSNGVGSLRPNSAVSIKNV
ncbi:hypothetical protein OAE88_00695 [bacterium]|nr:hypothetical protein [bacterium]